VTGVDLRASGGWCAPSEAMVQIWDPVLISRWPAGLTAGDIEWLSAMLWLGEIDPDPILFADALVTPPGLYGVRRGGIRFPMPGDAA
jgi:hypothetical protein